MAAALGVKADTVSAWQCRNSLPPVHWPRLLELAAARAMPEISLDTLAGSHIATLHRWRRCPICAARALREQQAAA